MAAICGRMPLMMQSAPISRAAVTVFSRCCATSVSTVGTPVMSMMATPAPVSTMRWSSDSMTTWVRALSSVPIMGSASMPSQSFTTGVDSSSMSSCCRAMMRSRPLMKSSVGVEAELVQQDRGPPQLVRQPIAVIAQLVAQPGEERLLEREDEGGRLARREPLARAGLRDPAEHLAHLFPLGAVDPREIAVGRAWRIRRRNSRDWPRSSASLMRSERSVVAANCSRNQSVEKVVFELLEHFRNHTDGSWAHADLRREGGRRKV